MPNLLPPLDQPIPAAVLVWFADLIGSGDEAPLPTLSGRDLSALLLSIAAVARATIAHRNARHTEAAENARHHRAMQEVMASANTLDRVLAELQERATTIADEYGPSLENIEARELTPPELPF